ncbi:MAG: hypothetical protein J6X38_06960 [Abditibacteriota bacterium]|nr:hypothetical protein [Abditibacteriota bacterium]
MKYVLILILLASCAFGGDIIDRRSDTWTATDALGRTLPDFDVLGGVRKDRYVGIFYFLWLGQHNTYLEKGPYDVAKILKAHPKAMSDWNDPLWAPPMPETVQHYWGEPLFGYYRGSDPWVLRKHADMLTDAGVDFVVFDMSNGFIYEENLIALCETWTEMRREGNGTPQIVCLTPFWNPVDTVERLWNLIYSEGKYKDLWFMWEGKPLLLADFNLMRSGKCDKYADFFTLRRPEAGYFDKAYCPNSWSWLQKYPQHIFMDDEGNIEEMSVGVAQNANERGLCAFSEPGTYGRSYHGGRDDEREDGYLYGLNFAEQWDRALSVDPEVVFVTGWNEWIACRLNNFHNSDGAVQFVDCYSAEKSRDIEPMKGGYGDNYYYQLAANVRKFKGGREQKAVTERLTVTDAASWDKVKLTYRDSIGDTAHRDYLGAQGAGPYTNNTGRNDIVSCKVVRDDEFVYFMARCREPITSIYDGCHMVLMIDADNDPTTGENSFDYRVNHLILSDKTLIESFDGDEWVECCEARYEQEGDMFLVEVPIYVLGFTADEDVTLGFKWFDHIRKLGDPISWISDGDTAPNGRFVYKYISK